MSQAIWDIFKKCDDYKAECQVSLRDKICGIKISLGKDVSGGSRIGNLKKHVMRNHPHILDI